MSIAEQVAARFRVAHRVAARFRQAVMQMPVNDALQVLGFPPGATPSDAEINRKQRQRAVEVHPDRGGDPAQLIDVNNAADALRAYNERGQTGPFTGPTPPPSAYTPQPKAKPIVVTFDEAKSKVSIPTDVNWWFVTAPHSSGYSTDESTRRATGYVVVGETEQSWVFVAVEHFVNAYFYITSDPDRDTYTFTVFRTPKKGPPDASELNAGIAKIWKGFYKLEKKFNSTVIPLPENWVLGPKLPGGSGTTIKKLLADKGLLSEEAASTIKTTVEMKVETSYGEKPGFHPEPVKGDRQPHDWFKITLAINGREYALSERDTQRLFVASPTITVSKFLSLAFGNYYHHGGRKVLTRLAKGKILLTFLADKMQDLPAAAVDALRAAAARLS